MKKPAILLLVLLIFACFHACEEPVEPQDPIPPPPPPLPNYEGYYIGKSEISDFREIQVFWYDSTAWRVMDSMFVYKDTSYMRVDTVEVRKVEGDTIYMVHWKGAEASDLFYQGEKPIPVGRDSRHHVKNLDVGFNRRSTDYDLESYSLNVRSLGTEDSMWSKYSWSDFATPNYGYSIYLSFEATRRDSLD